MSEKGQGQGYTRVWSEVRLELGHQEGRAQGQRPEALPHDVAEGMPRRYIVCADKEVEAGQAQALVGLWLLMLWELLFPLPPPPHIHIALCRSQQSTDLRSS